MPRHPVGPAGIEPTTSTVEALRFTPRIVEAAADTWTYAEEKLAPVIPIDIRRSESGSRQSHGADHAFTG